MKTDAEEARQIRQELKAELGLNSRQVSVRCTRGGSIRIEIKDPTVKKSQVETIAKKVEHVRYFRVRRVQ